MGAKPAFPTGEAMEVYTMLLRAATSKRLSEEMITLAHEDLDRLPADAIPYRRRMLEAQTMLHRDWLRWNERRYELMAGWEAWFETFDLMLCPAASSPAFPHDQAGRAPRPGDHRQRPAPSRPLISSSGPATPAGTTCPRRSPRSGSRTVCRSASRSSAASTTTSPACTWRRSSRKAIAASRRPRAID